MNFEDFQKAWQAQDPGANVTVNAEALLKAVRRHQHQFRSTIFWRDLREVGVAFVMTVFFCSLGVLQRDWMDGLVGLACFWVGAFLLVDRWLQRRKQSTAEQPLKDCLEASLEEVNHQIWLLKNVFWWYLLPIGAGVAFWFAHTAWQAEPSGSSVLRDVLLKWLVLGGVFWGVYWLNQYAVRKCLEARRRALAELLASLTEPRP